MSDSSRPVGSQDARPQGFRADLTLLLDAFGDVPEVVRVLKVAEEAGEAAQAYIGVTGLNPRKGITHSNDELADELADVALTALVALGAFTADPIQRLTNRVAYVADRHRREVSDA